MICLSNYHNYFREFESIYQKRKSIFFVPHRQDFRMLASGSLFLPLPIHEFSQIVA